MRITLFVLTLILTGCSNPIDGLWIEKEESSLLKFYEDSVISSSLQISWFRDTVGYFRTTDSITFTGLDPEVTNGITERTLRYIFKDDSLIIWYSPDARISYFKSDAEDYLANERIDCLGQTLVKRMSLNCASHQFALQEANQYLLTGNKKKALEAFKNSVSGEKIGIE